MVKPLGRKLLRDVARMKGQVLTVALVVASGIASFVGLRSTLASLESSKTTYYERYRFADVFATIERAPEDGAASLERIPGVARVYTRIVEDVRIPLEGERASATARLVSLPDGASPPMNALHLRAGRMPESQRDDEAVLLEAFARAHGLRPGHRLAVVMNGKLRTLVIVGVALSPEYVYALRPGSLTDEPGKFAVLWMNRSALAAALQREGSFNDAVVSVAPGVSAALVAETVERTLAPYGVKSVVPRERQMSNHILTGEIEQLGPIAGLVTAIFLGVAAFLVNVILSRLVALQRPELAALKALGYSNGEIARHYLGLVAIVVALGAIIGTAAGAWYGTWMTGMYGRVFNFPVLRYEVTAGVVLGGVLISFAAAAGGALFAIRAAVRLPPAEAMRPPAPAVYRSGAPGRATAALGPSAMMIARELLRRPLRTFLSAIGVGAAVGVLVMGRFMGDAFEYLISDLLVQQHRQDLTVALWRPTSGRAVAEVAHQPGVIVAEPMRTVPVRFANGAKERDAAIVALPEGATLRRVLDARGEVVPVPPAGVMLTRKLAELLDVSPGGSVDVEVREGDRPLRRVSVAATVDETLGLQGYMTLPALERLLGQERTVTAVLVRTEPGMADAVAHRLAESPRVASVDRMQELVDGLRAQTGQSMGLITLVITILASCIAVGVVYNTARISLSQRSRDLASLRVLGFTRREISSVLLGEMAVQTAIGLPLGVLLGRWWASALATGSDPETLRLPTIIASSTYLTAVVITVLAAAASALLVRRRLDRLDLIGVLKTRE